MTIDDAMRLRIHHKLTELMGPEEADAIVANWLPWREVATKDDLRVLSAELHTEMAELHTEMAELRGELRADMHSIVTSQTRWILGYITALAAAVITTVQLLP